MLATLGKIIWIASIVVAAILGLIILTSAASEGRLFEAETFLAVVIWSGGSLLAGRFIYAVLK